MRKLIVNIGELATPFGRNAWGGADQKKRVERYASHLRRIPAK